MLLPCCFRQSVCLWCVAASVEQRNSIDCIRCGGNFHGPFGSDLMYRNNTSFTPPPSFRMNGSCASRSQQQQQTSSASSRSNSDGTLCNISGCNRRALEEACFHCGSWLCSIDDFIHKEDIADKQITMLDVVLQRAREWLAAFSEKSSPDYTEVASVQVPASAPTSPRGVKKQANSIESVDVSSKPKGIVLNAFVSSKTEELALIIDRSEKLLMLLESKRARRLDLRAIASEINEMKKKVLFVEPVNGNAKLTATRPTYIQVPSTNRNLQSPLSPQQPLRLANYRQRLNSGSLNSMSLESNDAVTQVLMNACAQNNDISTVEKLKIAIAVEEERLKERRKTVSGTRLLPVPHTEVHRNSVNYVS